MPDCICCRYANRAKNIKNKAKINEDPKDALLREFQKEIERLKSQITDGLWRALHRWHTQHFADSYKVT